VGKNTTTDLIAAASDLVNASLREINAILDWKVAEIRLSHATGSDIPAAK
jgi:outer membrane protein TolC